MKNDQFDARIRAALLWDTAALFAHGDGPSMSFLRVLKGQLAQLSIPDEEERDPLALAAKCVHQFFTGNDSDATLTANSLAAREPSDESLLGLMLMCWIGSVEDTIWQRARDIAIAQQEPQFVAHLLTKLFVYAYDEGKNELSESLLTEAKALASGALRKQLEVVGTNFYGHDFPIDSQPYPGDDLVDLPWVMEAALDSVDTVLKDLSIDRVASASSARQRFGMTGRSRLRIAESQATWAGALWRRGRIRSSLASTFVLEGPSDDEDARELVALWISTGRSSVDSAVDYAEPFFKPDTADVILSEDVAMELHTRVGRPHFVDGANALWDLVSDEFGLRLLGMLQPTDSDHPTEAKIRMIWARLALRLQNRWLDLFDPLAESAQRKILSSFAPSAARLLPEGVLREASRLFSGTVESDDLAFALSVRLRLREDAADLYEALTAAPPEQINDLLSEGIDVPDEATQGASDELLTRVRDDLRKGRLGTYSFGAGDPRAQLGRLASYGRGDVEAAGQLLLESVMDQSAKGQMRLGAMRGLLDLAIAGLLDDASYVALLYAPAVDDSHEPFLGTSSDLLMAYRTAILSIREPESHLPQLLTLTRARDSSARAVVIRALGQLADQVAVDTVASALTGALHDPEPHVVSEAIRSLPPTAIEESVWSRSIVERLISLYPRSRRVLRLQIAEFARRNAEAVQPEIDRLRSWATADRSWTIRSLFEVQDSTEG